MREINFKRKVNFWELSTFTRKNKISCEVLVKQAYEKGFLEDKNNFLLGKFINHFKNKEKYKSQLFQDIFASFIVGERFDKTFLEFGATDGLNLSNSYMLKNFLGWKGILSEPSPQWHDSLKINREETEIITKCIWSETGKTLNFFMSETGIFSTLSDYVDSDINSLPENTKKRKKAGKLITVNTISLNDVIKDYFHNKPPSYISVDTEGSEYEILEAFNFKKFRPIVFTIEHNFTIYEKKINDLMILNNYIRVFKDITAFDAWYVSEEAYNQINLKKED